MAQEQKQKGGGGGGEESSGKDGGGQKLAKKGWLDVEMEGNTNYYSAAIPLEDGLRLEIERFLSETIGSDPEHLELLQEALDARLPKAKTRRLKSS